jgi:hypothetical protein
MILEKTQGLLWNCFCKGNFWNCFCKGNPRRLGVGVGRAGWEAEAQEEWRWSGCLGRLGQKVGRANLGPRAEIKEELLSEF